MAGRQSDRGDTPKMHSAVKKVVPNRGAEEVKRKSATKEEQEP